ncbi:MAG TPA: FAD-binding oxidoreductase [Patescibacteria group bacterium]|nr:FAD-binding oxidoreductase [Patescibacteria group bacterium]
MLQDFIATVTKKKVITEDMLLLQYKLISPKEIDFIAGQYVLVDIPQENKEKATRLYSLYSPNYQKRYVELLIHTIPNGLASLYFIHLEERETVNFRGPAGKFILQSEDRDKIFLATGTGIAPIRSMIHSFFHRHAYTSFDTPAPQIQLFWGVKTMNEAYLKDELTTLKNLYKNFSFTICLSREKNAVFTEHEEKNSELSCLKRGRITDNFNKEKASSDTEYYICGGPEVVVSLTAFLKNQHIAHENIFFEKF